MAKAASLAVVVLTEDSGKDGRATVEALARRMLHLVVPNFGSHRVQFMPRDPPEDEAMRGNVWKTDGRNPREHERRVRLQRYIVRQLSLPNTFVLFHIDGDRPWSERHTSENVEKFERFRTALPRVAERGRANNPRALAREHGQTSPGDMSVMRLEHLILICPFRSIEAWLYQNTRAAIDICGRTHRSAHVSELQAWERRRGDLDELPSPHDTVCLGKAFNLELARRGFPARDAYDVKKSFSDAVDRLRACSALVRALELTRS